jgi:hypothetical protein
MEQEHGYESETMLIREAQAIVSKLPPDPDQARRVLAYAAELLEFETQMAAGSFAKNVTPLRLRRLRPFVAGLAFMLCYQVGQIAGQPGLYSIV